MNIKNILIVLLLVFCLCFIYYFWDSANNLKEIIENKDKSIESLRENITIKDKNNIKLKDEKNKIHIHNQELEKNIEQIKQDSEKVIKEKESLQIELEKERKKNRASRSSGIVNNSSAVYKSFVATAYCGCRKCNGKWTGMPTASGTSYKAGRTIAVDPKVIPFGSKVEVEGMGTYVAEDSGSAIKGNIIDIYFNSHAEALKFGRRKIKLRVL